MLTSVLTQKYATVPENDVIDTTAEALRGNGFAVTVVEDLAAAKGAALALLPKGAEVLTATSRTLEDTGIESAINESGDYDALRPRFVQMGADPAQRDQMRKLGAGPDFVIGSVHAATHQGEVMVASATASQLAPYVFGAGQVIWVVGAQKIVADLAEAQKRLEQYTFPLEDERAHKAYGSGSSINKELIVYRERPGRINIILVKQAVGF